MCVCVCVCMCGFCNVCVLVNVYCTLTEVLLNLAEVFLILTEIFPCFFLSCKANARVKRAKTGHGPHSTTLVVICVVRYLCCSVYCLCVNVYCHRTTTQLQLINIISYMQNVNRCMHSVHVQLIPSETHFSCRFLLIGQLVHLIIYFVCILRAASRLQCKNGSVHVAQDYSNRAF